jgi:hypothetical protein
MLTISRPNCLNQDLQTIFSDLIVRYHVLPELQNNNQPSVNFPEVMVLTLL